MANLSTIPLSVPRFGGNEWKYLKECLDTGWVSSAGPYVQRFEEKISGCLGELHAVATVNGTASLHIALLVCGVKAGDEVLVPTLTFIAPVNTVKYVGAQPVFMDCDNYLNINPEKVKDFCERECMVRDDLLVNKTTGAAVKAIIVVHIFGHPVDLDPIQELASKYRFRIIEDATESLGSFYKEGPNAGKKTGAVGDVGCYSFNGNKIITTGGGGMIVTSDESMARRARYLTTQAKDDELHFLHSEVGYNYRLTNLQSALGCAQLEQLDDYVRIKRKNFSLYCNELEGVRGLRLLSEPPYGSSNYWYYTLVIDEKQYGKDALTLLQHLADRKIQTRPLWELNHRQKPYQRCQSYHIEKAADFYGKCLSLPCSVSLTPEEISRVCEAIRPS